MSESGKITSRNRLDRIGAIVAIVAGLGGLATGTVSLVVTFATYQSAQEDAKRLYANKVLTYTFGGKAYIQNYGPLPIGRAEAVLRPETVFNSKSLEEMNPSDIVLFLGSIPPCSQVDITDWSRSAGGKIKGGAGLLARFDDMNGIRWARSGPGVPTRTEVGAGEYSIDDKSASVEPLPKCP